jgi:hypothetical protein
MITKAADYKRSIRREQSKFIRKEPLLHIMITKAADYKHSVRRDQSEFIRKEPLLHIMITKAVDYEDISIQRIGKGR